MLRVQVTDLGSSGEGVASQDGYRLFIDGALPGEEVLYEIIQKKKTYAKAKAVEVVNSSKERVTPPCPYYGKCGGCQLQHLSYEGQLRYKRKKVADALIRIGKIDAEVAPCIPSPDPFGYRNKIQLPKQGDRLGLYRKGTHDLIDIEACLLHSPVGEEVYHAIRPLLLKKDLRAVLIKSTRKTSEALVTLVSRKKNITKEIANTILASHPAIKGVVLCVNTQEGNALLGAHFEILAGLENITEELNGLKFSISSASFFQVNPAQAEALYSKALELAAISGEETVIDAYCGVGTLALTFAKHAKKVLGIECVPQAIEDAEENARKNSIKNAQFTVGRAEYELPKCKADVLLLNPPRKGVDPRVIESIGISRPKKIVYISCDPATLARDSALLVELGYKPGIYTPFDMFPQTSHVETVTSYSL
jgi:23S rRNA (uracil1939-C5)-methyltransferase